MMPIRADPAPTAIATGIRRRLSAIGAYVTIAAVALYDRIEAELVDSRRRRDSVTLDTLSLLKSELVKASKESTAGGKIDDELVVRLARKEVKRREEAIEVYRKAGRADSARREEAEMEVLKTFLPATMSEKDVEAEVAAVIAEIKPDGPKGFGIVMKAATARLAGRAEGAQVAAAARKLPGSQDRQESQEVVDVASPSPRGEDASSAHGRAVARPVPSGHRARTPGSVPAGDRDDPLGSNDRPVREPRHARAVQALSNRRRPRRRRPGRGRGADQADRVLQAQDPKDHRCQPEDRRALRRRGTADA